MTKPAAFKGTYADWKLVKTRGVVQIIVEVPLAESDDAYEILGGMPNPAQERWVAIAAINSAEPAQNRSMATAGADRRLERADIGGDDVNNPTSNVTLNAPLLSKLKTAAGEKQKRDWRNVPPAEQAGIRCEDPVFAAFLREKHWEVFRDLEQDPAEFVRAFCHVGSRKSLNTEQYSRVIWNQLDQEFQAWNYAEAMP